MQGTTPDPYRLLDELDSGGIGNARRAEGRLHREIAAAAKQAGL